MTEIMMEQA
ncbi:Protein of unknown function [Lactobacillus helveticus CIRM-BIA 953]|uniref:Uncharacterized protein n=1 Tax=Lactobacillus helveticus CIRM-BIA 953 TaxID=1226335 RepID=U4QKC3_LACHE|nr:Protein of unknown function [Lactobacillus helveticus CIRM-BIA 953]